MRLPPWLWHFLASKRTHRALIIAPFALMVLATIAYVTVDLQGEEQFEKEFAQNPATLFAEFDTSKHRDYISLSARPIPYDAPSEVWTRAMARPRWLGCGNDPIVKMMYAISEGKASQQEATEHLKTFGSLMENNHLDLQSLPCPTTIENAQLQRFQEVICSGIKQRYWTPEALTSYQIRAFRPNLQNDCIRSLARVRSMTASHARDAVRQFRASFNWRHFCDSTWKAAATRDRHLLHSKCTLAWRQWQPAGLNLAEIAKYLQHLRENDPSCRTDGPPYFTFADFQKFQRMAADDEPLGSGAYLLELCETTLDFQTDHDLLQCGIAVERHRLKYGDHPLTLEELIPEFLTEIPRDVCDGSPLRYRLNADGSAQVWSLWPSGKDADGEPATMHGTTNWTWVTGKISN